MDAIKWADLSALTEDEKEIAFGREFRVIPMLRMRMLPITHSMAVECVVQGRTIVLIGDPQKALITYLGGVREGGDTLHA